MHFLRQLCNKKLICIYGVCSLSLFVLLLVGYVATPKETLLRKDIPCTVQGTQDAVMVQIDGIYQAFLWGDDRFNGTITVPGWYVRHGHYVFKDDKVSHFVDDEGQPYGHIVQSNQFEVLTIMENEYTLQSEIRKE